MGCRTAAIGILFALVAFAQAGQNANPNVRDQRVQRGAQFLGLGAPPDTAAAILGEKLYSANCAFCHGANATGGEGPNLIRSSLVLHDEKGELIGPVIQNGRSEKGMPAFPNFTAEQRYDLAEFLHQRVYDAVNRWGYQVGNIVTGNAAAGQAYFAARCASCHSATGDLARIATKYQPTDLQALFLYPGTLLHIPVSVTVETKSGEHVTGTLLAQDDFTITVKENSGEIASWPTSDIHFQTHDPLTPHLDLLPHYTNADVHNLLAYLVTLK